MSRSSIPRALRSEVQRRDADRCLYCGLLQVGQGARPSMWTASPAQDSTNGSPGGKLPTGTITPYPPLAEGPGGGFLE
jgi:hypothetical protein